MLATASGAQSTKTVLIVAAHCDDAEIGMAMRMLAHADGGDRVLVHCLASESGQTGRRRKDECRRAGDILGVSEYSFSDFPPSRLLEHRWEVNQLLQQVMLDHRPDIVYTHFPKDQHPDHVTCASETTTLALRETPTVVYFRSPYSHAFDTNEIFVTSKSALERKTAALACYSSQPQTPLQSVLGLNRVDLHSHLHHRVVCLLPPDAVAEPFHILRRVEVAAPTAQTDAACRAGSNAARQSPSNEVV